MRLEIRSARTTLNPTRQEVMPRRAARFFRFSLSLSLSLPLSVSLLLFPLSVLCLTFLPSYLPTYLLPTYHSHLIRHVFVCNHVLLEDSAACAGMFGFLLLSFSILNQRHPPSPNWHLMYYFFFLRPIPHSCYLPNFPTLFAGTIVSLLFSISIIFYPSLKFMLLI